MSRGMKLIILIMTLAVSMKQEGLLLIIIKSIMEVGVNIFIYQMIWRIKIRNFIPGLLIIKMTT